MSFYIIMANLNPGVTIADAQAALGAYSIDYYRIAPNVWIVFSYFGSKMLSDLMTPLTTPGGSHLVSRADMTDKNGMLVPDVWTWIRKHGA